MSKIFSRYQFLFVFAMLLHGKLLFAQESIIRIMSADDKELALVECDDYYDYNKGFAAVKVDSFWAFYDSNGKQQFYQLKMIYAESFADNGLALIQTEQGYGFINTSGAAVVPTIYSSAYGFDFSNLALVEKDYKWGALGPKGNVIIPVEYDGIQSLGAVVAVIKGDAVAFFSNEGKQLTGFDYTGYGRSNYDVVGILSNNGWSFIDKHGNVSSPQFYNDLGQYSEGLIGILSGDKIGYVNAKGELKIPPLFESADEFSGGLAAVKKDGLWGYIDTTGKVVIPFMYQSAFKFYDGIASVTKGDQWLTINKNNEIVPEKKQEVITPKTVHIIEVDANEQVVLKYPKYNFKVEKTWKGYNGDATNGKIYLLSTGKLLGEEIVFSKQQILTGIFYKNNQAVPINAPQGIAMADLVKVIDEECITQEKQRAAEKAAQEQAKLNNNASTTTTNAVDLHQLYVTLLDDLQAIDAQFDYYLDIGTEFDMDATSAEEAKANKEKKIKPYVDLVNGVVTRIDYLLANDPNMTEELKKELHDFRAAALQKLKWIQ